MRQPPVQIGIFLIDDYIFIDEEDTLPKLKQFINELAAKLDIEIVGVAITRNRKLANHSCYYEGYMSPCVRMVANLLLPSGSGAEGDVGWADAIGDAISTVIDSIQVRKELGVGLWLYVDSRSRVSKEPLELVYWVFLFTGFYPLFMRRVVHFGDKFIEWPSHTSASDIVIRKGRDYRALMLMSLAAIYLGVANTSFKIAKAIEEVFRDSEFEREFKSADALRRKIKHIMDHAASYCLVSIVEGRSTYAILPFGKLLLDALLGSKLMRHIRPREAATFIERMVAESGAE
jgi:hypothetical protein